MAIASGASDGIRADSAAKESVGNASTLGSQTAAAPDEVIVPDAITANNEGNLASTPSYVGRMIAIRPWEMRLAKVPTVQAGGSGYAVSDTIDLNGVAGVTGTAVLTVTAVNAGAVTAVEITEADGVEIRRQGMTSAPSPADNPVGQAATSGSGTSATFNCIWEPHFEIRFCTGDATNTLTVHEPWDTPPVSGDNWAVGYILDDYATQTGLTLRSQSGVFEATRRIKIGPLTDGTRRGWLAMNDGKALELDNLASGNVFESANGGLFTCGYVQGGESVNGAYISTSGTGNPTMEINGNEGAMAFVHDLQIRSPREQLSFQGVDSGPSDADEVKWYREVGNIVRNVKFFDVAMRQGGYRLQQASLQQSPTSTIPATGIPVEGGDGPGIAQVDGFVWIGNEDLSTGYTAQADNTGVEVFEGLRNITFLFPEGSEYLTLDDYETWRFVNAVWDTTPRNTVFSPAPSTRFDHLNGFLGTPTVELQMSLVVRPVTTAGVGISGIHGYVYEGALNNDLPTENTNQSDSVAYDPVELDDFRFELKIETGDIAYYSDLLVELWTGLAGNGGSGSGYFQPFPRNRFSWRGYAYGLLPVTIPITLTLQGGVDTQAVFLADPAITEAVQADALTNPTTNPTVTKHGPGETDTRPMKALNYDAGVDGVPAVGVTVTQGSATGDVLEVLGSGVSGTLLLENWNGTEFTDGQNITGTGFDATTDLTGGTGFYEEYTWEVNAQGEAMTIVYDYLAARMAEATLVTPFEDVIIWGGDEPDANQLLFFGADGYFTNRATRIQDYVHDGTAADFTDAFPQADSNLSADSDWEDLGNAADEIRVVSNEAAAGTTDDTTNVTAVVTGTFDPAPDQWAEATLDVDTTTTGSRLGVAVRIDAARQECYAAVATGNSDWQICHYDFSTAVGVVSVLAEGTLPVITEVFRLQVAGNVLILYIDGVEETRYVDNGGQNKPITAGQVGIVASGGGVTPAGRIDDFAAGDFVNDSNAGEGVWIHDRGAGDLDFMTSDGGTQYVPAATVTLRVQGVTEGSSIKVIANETAGSVTLGDTLLEGFADSNGVLENTSFIYEAAFGAGLDVLVRARNQGIATAAISDDGGTQADETTEANDASASPVMNLTPAAGYAAGDAYYFAHTEQFAQMKLDVSQAWGAVIKTIVWEYWDGLTWSSLSDMLISFNDGTTSAFGGEAYSTPTGERLIGWTVPGDWATTSVNSQGPFYYVRARINVGGASAQAQGRKVTIDATRYLPFPQTGFAEFTITSTGLTVIAVWTEDTISTFKSSDFA